MKFGMQLKSVLKLLGKYLKRSDKPFQNVWIP